jgi:hypothetical protein
MAGPGMDRTQGSCGQVEPMIELLVNEVLPDGMRHVKVVSDAPLSASTLTSPQIRESTKFGGSVREWRDEVLGLNYLEAGWACMEVVHVQLEGQPKCRKLVVWKFLPGERVSEIITYVADWFFVQTHHRPEYAFMRSLPSGVESGTEVDGVMLMQADWALPGCVMVGG